MGVSWAMVNSLAVVLCMAANLAAGCVPQNAHLPPRSTRRMVMPGRQLLAGPRQPSTRSCGLHGVDKQAHNALMAKAEAAVYGARQSAFNSSDQLKAAVLASPWPAGGLTMRVQFHIIQWQGYSSITDTSTPPVDSSQISAQIDVITNDYQATGITFVPAGQPMFHTNQAWTANCQGNLQNIYNAVVINPTTTLNIVVCDLVSQGGVLGITPAMPGTSPETSKQCIAIDYRSMPGGPYNRYSLGRTLTHELGHWFGLLHTFGSCDVDADGVADTPRELSAASGCPMRRDSCPSYPGTDPVWSFMDYSDDQCMQRFSPGQIARMRAAVMALRPKFFVASGGNAAAAKRSKAANLKRLKAAG